MLTESDKDLISNYSISIRERLRESDAMDEGERIRFIERTRSWLTENTFARMLRSEDLEAALLMPIDAGLLQCKRRILTRYRAFVEKNRGWPPSDEELLELFPATPPELFEDGFAAEREGDEF